MAASCLSQSEGGGRLRADRNEVSLTRAGLASLKRAGALIRLQGEGIEHLQCFRWRTSPCMVHEWLHSHCCLDVQVMHASVVQVMHALVPASSQIPCTAFPLQFLCLHVSHDAKL